MPSRLEVKDKMEEKINEKSIVLRNPDQVYTVIDDEVVFLSFNTGEYVALNATATQIWEKIYTPTVVEELINGLLVEYDVLRDKCNLETIECLNDLLERGIIEISND